jgi:hypothetical protein
MKHLMAALLAFLGVELIVVLVVFVGIVLMAGALGGSC